jgi:hypothetical protein
MTIEYNIKSESPVSAKILFRGKVFAHLQKKSHDIFSLETVAGPVWTLMRRVNGEIRPFSLSIQSTSGSPGEREFKIRDHIFAYGDKMYMLGALPEGRATYPQMRGTKFICRLDGFPFQDPDQVDSETRSRLKRLRGAVVGEFSGIGRKAHSVKIEEELRQIGLQMAAACFVLYSTT